MAWSSKRETTSPRFWSHRPQWRWHRPLPVGGMHGRMAQGRFMPGARAVRPVSSKWPVSPSRGYSSSLAPQGERPPPRRVLREKFSRGRRHPRQVRWNWARRCMGRARHMGFSSKTSIQTAHFTSRSRHSSLGNPSPGCLLPAKRHRPSHTPPVLTHPRFRRTPDLRASHATLPM